MRRLAVHGGSDRERGMARAPHAMRTGALATLALLGVACTQARDPLTERCLEALAYRVPSHGEIEAIESDASPLRRSVTIRYAAAESSQSLTCEVPPGEPWNFQRIAIDGRDVSEAELALVNAEFLLRDLSRNPQRFVDPPAVGAGGSSAPDGAPASNRT